MGECMASALFDRHHLAIYRYLRRMTGRADVAEDLTQEVFLRVVRGLEHYEPRAQERAWLFQIARNLLLDRFRREERHPEPVDIGSIAEPAGGADAFLGSSLEQALAAVADPEREAFLLRELGGLSYAEIAAVAGGSADAVRSRIFRARQVLRAALRPTRAARPLPAKEST